MIHPTSIISPNARLGSAVSVGPYTIIHDNVEIGDNSSIGSHCEIGVATSLGDGSPLRIGDGANIRSHSILYESSSFGDKLVTGHRITVRENTRAGHNLQIGTLCDIQGDCTIGDYVRFHSNVHIGKCSVIEDFVWIFPYVVLTNDPHPPSNVLKGVTLRRFSVVATMSTVLPGVEVGEGALIGACTNVTRDVAPQRIVSGNPGEDRGSTERIRLKDGTNRPAYPWNTHFTRGYPPEVVAAWNVLEGKDPC